jgi:hypothetical protein
MLATATTLPKDSAGYVLEAKWAARWLASTELLSCSAARRRD